MIIDTLLTLAGVLCLTGAIGMLRFRDFFSRIHAATIVSVGGVYFAISLLAVRGWPEAYFFKGILIIIILMITDPAATHAIAEKSMRIEKPFGVLAVNEMERRQKT